MEPPENNRTLQSQVFQHSKTIYPIFIYPVKFDIAYFQEPEWKLTIFYMDNLGIRNLHFLLLLLRKQKCQHTNEKGRIYALRQNS